MPYFSLGKVFKPNSEYAKIVEYIITPNQNWRFYYVRHETKITLSRPQCAMLEIASKIFEDMTKENIVLTGRAAAASISLNVFVLTV